MNSPCVMRLRRWTFRASGGVKCGKIEGCSFDVTWGESNLSRMFEKNHKPLVNRALPAPVKVVTLEVSLIAHWICSTINIEWAVANL
jgi:hypothetical protein